MVSSSCTLPLNLIHRLQFHYMTVWFVYRSMTWSWMWWNYSLWRSLEEIEAAGDKVNDTALTIFHFLWSGQQVSNARFVQRQQADNCCSSQHREEAGIAKVAFLAHQNYEETLLPQLVAAAANITGTYALHTSNCFTHKHLSVWAMVDAEWADISNQH